MEDKLISEPADGFNVLMRFIRKSVLANNSSLLEGEHIRKGAIALKDALDTGDANALVFEDQDAPLYAIYLLKERWIDKEKFLTAYLYLSVLMQFTEKQLLHPEHLEARRLDWGKPMVLQDSDPSLLMQYAQKLEKTFNYQILAQDIGRYFALTHDSEGWIIAIPFVNQSGDDVAKMMETNMRFSPLLQQHVINEQKYILSPSMGFANWLLKRLNPERQIEMAPCFGNVGIESLYNLHCQNKHPVTIHSAYIKSNPKKIHESQAGPVAFALHDIFFHVFGATAFKKDEYDFLMRQVIPALREIAHTETGVNQSLARNMWQTLNDLAFNPRNLVENNNLKQYLKSKLDSSFYGSNEAGQLSEEEQQAYFVVMQKLCTQLLSGEQKLHDYSLDILKGGISMSFIDDIEFSLEEAQKNALDGILNLKIDFRANKADLLRQLTEVILKDPALCIWINRAGHCFMPPLHPLPENLLTQVLNRVNQKSMSPEPVSLSNRYSLFKESPPAEIDEPVHHVQKGNDM